MQELRCRVAELDDFILNSKTIHQQSMALSQEHYLTQIKDQQELLQDITQAFLVQYEYLRNRRAFHSIHRLPWIKLMNRISATECLEELYEKYEKKTKKQPAAEFKETATSCKLDEKLKVKKSEVATNTEEEVVTRKPVTTREIGVNTKAGHRVTRATQATEQKAKSVDSSTQCEDAAKLDDTEESSLDVGDIFKSTICVLPEILTEIDDLEVPRVSSSSQTDEAPKASKETLTDEHGSYVGRTAKENVEPVKSELPIEGSDGRPMDDFERYWNMAGRSLVNALMGMKPREEEIPAGLQCFQGQFLQQQLIAKFLSGQSVPVKKAVSIPSVYAESTKSGFEGDVQGDLSREPSEERGELIEHKIDKINF